MCLQTSTPSTLPPYPQGMLLAAAPLHMEEAAASTTDN
jgi:hypothetical protein